jgi:hypothetical protein
MRLFESLYTKFLFRIIAKLEERIRALEQELDGEQRRHADTDKNYRLVISRFYFS